MPEKLSPLHPDTRPERSQEVKQERKESEWSGSSHDPYGRARDRILKTLYGSQDNKKKDK